MSEIETNTVITAVVDDEVENLQNSCRLCLSPKNQEILLFNINQHFNIKYSDIALTLADIKIDENDNLPKYICNECSLKLILFYKFKQKCELSYCTLIAILSNIIEIDSPSNYTKSEESEDISESLFTNLDQQNYSNESSDLIEIIKDDNISSKFDQTADKIVYEMADIKPFSQKLLQLKTPVQKQDNSSFINCWKSEKNLENNYDDDDDEQLKSPVFENTNIYNENENRIEEKENNVNNNPWNNEIYYCDKCKQIFASRSSLKQHSLLHLSEKKFPCELCGRKFTRKQYAILHMRAHNNIRPYVCNVCSCNFIKSSDLIRHKKIHSDRKDFICEICGKAFKRSTDLNNHINSHTGNKPYSCEICKKSYSSYSSMMKHCRKFEHL